jgi:hypothetical protein
MGPIDGIILHPSSSIEILETYYDRLGPSKETPRSLYEVFESEVPGRVELPTDNKTNPMTV